MGWIFEYCFIVACCLRLLRIRCPRLLGWNEAIRGRALAWQVEVNNAALVVLHPAYAAYTGLATNIHANGNLYIKHVYYTWLQRAIRNKYKRNNPEHKRLEIFCVSSWIVMRHQKNNHKTMFSSQTKKNKFRPLPRSNFNFECWYLFLNGCSQNSKFRIRPLPGRISMFEFGY